MIPDCEFYAGFFQIFWSKAIIDHGVVEYWVCSFCHCSCFLATFSASVWKNGTSERKSIVSLHLHSIACIKHTEQTKTTDSHCPLHVRMCLKIRHFSVMEVKSKVIFSVPSKKYWQHVTSLVLQRMEGKGESGGEEHKWVYLLYYQLMMLKPFCCCQSFPNHLVILVSLHFQSVCGKEGRRNTTMLLTSVSSHDLLS